MYSDSVHGWFGLVLGFGIPIYMLVSNVIMDAMFGEQIGAWFDDVYGMFGWNRE